MIKRKRPDFGSRQVRTMEGVKPGYFYREMRGSIPSRTILVVTKPAQDKKGCWWVGTLNTILPYDQQYIQATSLADNGVVPYQLGGYSQTNALFRMSRPPLSAKALEEVLKKVHVSADAKELFEL